MKSIKWIRESRSEKYLLRTSVWCGVFFKLMFSWFTTKFIPFVVAWVQNNFVCYMCVVYNVQQDGNEIRTLSNETASNCFFFFSKSITWCSTIPVCGVQAPRDPLETNCWNISKTEDEITSPKVWQKILEFARAFCGAEDHFWLHKFCTAGVKNPLFHFNFLRILTLQNESLHNFWNISS